MVTPTVPWIKNETILKESEFKTNSSKEQKMKALVIINFNTIHREAI